MGFSPVSLRIESGPATRGVTCQTRRLRSNRVEEKKLWDLIKQGVGECQRRKRVKEEECVFGLVITDQAHDVSLIRGECCLIGLSRWLNVSDWSRIVYDL